MRLIEEDDGYVEDVEHTREAYASGVDYLRALERRGTLKEEPTDPAA